MASEEVRPAGSEGQPGSDGHKSNGETAPVAANAEASGDPSLGLPPTSANGGTKRPRESLESGAPPATMPPTTTTGSLTSATGAAPSTTTTMAGTSQAPPQTVPQQQTSEENNDDERRYEKRHHRDEDDEPPHKKPPPRGGVGTTNGDSDRRSGGREYDPRRHTRGTGEDIGRQVYLGNLDFRTEKEYVERELSRFGEVVDVFMPLDARSQPRGFAFVTFTEKRSAEDACDGLDGRDFDGRPVRCNIARPRPPAEEYRQRGRDSHRRGYDDDDDDDVDDDRGGRAPGPGRGDDDDRGGPRGNNTGPPGRARQLPPPPQSGGGGPSHRGGPIDDGRDGGPPSLARRPRDDDDDPYHRGGPVSSRGGPPPARRYPDGGAPSTAPPPQRDDGYDAPRDRDRDRPPPRRDDGYYDRAPYRDAPPPRYRSRPPPGRVFIYGLPDDIREPELEDLYYRCGRIEYIEIRRSSRSGRVEGVVVFEDFRDAEYAKRQTDGMRFERERITVELDDRF